MECEIYWNVECFFFFVPSALSLFSLTCLSPSFSFTFFLLSLVFMLNQQLINCKCKRRVKTKEIVVLCLLTSRNHNSSFFTSCKIFYGENDEEENLRIKNKVFKMFMNFSFSLLYVSCMKKFSLFVRWMFKFVWAFVVELLDYGRFSSSRASLTRVET